jgi:L-asparagine transporter-like permease
LEQVRATAERLGFAVEFAPTGVVSVPLLEPGKPLTPEGFELLPDGRKAELREHGRELAMVIDEAMPQVRRAALAAGERVRALDREAVGFAVGHLLDALRARYADVELVIGHLNRVQADLVSHLSEFGADDEGGESGPPGMARAYDFDQYRANVLISHDPGSGAPLVFEANPTFHNLLGRIDYRASLGGMATDFRLVRPGALHRANGGFLILQARDVLSSPFAWDGLKRALRERELGPLDLVVFGVGVTVGTGIFVLTGVVAATRAGPAVALSFLLAAAVCALTALCYAELASTVPVAGSAYTYTHATLGELPAWIIGWDLMLELAVGAATVAIGWSQYANAALRSVGLGLPGAAAGGEGGSVDILAAAIVLVLTGVAVMGMQLSARVTLVITTLKLASLVFFIVVGLALINPGNWKPFIPPQAPATATSAGSSFDAPLAQLVTGGGGIPLAFGVPGIIAGAALVFFAFIGFDIVATTAEETREPQQTLPIGILASLAIVTVLYVLVSVVLTGLVPYAQLNTAAPLATALAAVGQTWAVGIVSAGAPRASPASPR